MSLCNCSCKCRCTTVALVVSAIIGILTSFLQITGTITVTSVFLWVVFGIGIVGLGLFVVTAALARRADRCECLCNTLSALLLGLLGTILLSVVLLALGIVATSILDAILVGLLLFSLSLAITEAACFVRCLLNCGSE